MKKKRLLLLIIGLTAGSCVALLIYLNTSVSIKEKIESRIIKTLERDLDCFFSGHLESCNFLTGRFTLTDIRAVSKTNDWKWTTKKIALSFSWLHFIRFHFFKLRVICDDFDAYSIINNTDDMPLFAHFKKWSELPGGPVPVALKSIEIRRGFLNCEFDKRKSTGGFSCSFGACATPVKNMMHLDCIFEKGRIYNTGKEIFNEISGNVHVKINNPESTEEFSGFCTCAFLKSKPQAVVCGSRNATGGTICLNARTGDFDAQLNWNASHAVLSGTVKSAYIASVFGAAKPNICAEKLCYTVDVPYAMRKENAVEGTCTVTCGDMLSFDGKARYGEKLTVSLANKNVIPLSSFVSNICGEIKPQSAQVNCICDMQIGDLKSTVTAHITKKASSFSAPDMHNSDIRKNKSPVTIDGDISLIAGLSNGVADAHVQFKNGKLTVPDIYNGIRGITVNAHFDDTHASSIILNGRIELTKGTIEIPDASLSRADNAFTYSFTCIPTDCLVHFKKEMAAILSGSFVFEKRASDTLPIITGDLAVEKGEIKSTFLALITDQRSSLFGMMPFSAVNSFDTRLDLKLRSSAPLTVSTSLLKSNAQCNLSFGGTLTKPIIQGNIDLTDGLLQFPYRPLYITHGRILFLPHRLDNPVLEITAQNKIKKYDVTLTVSGFLKQPRLSFQSSPFLNEKQIATLLIGGFDTGSLYMSMPALLTNTLNDFIFGSPNADTHDSYTQFGLFKNPTHSIRIFPGLKQPESGPGMLGALTVEVDDDMRATVRKNLKGSGESAVEFEYDLSDNTRIRAVKDEHGEIGAEIEKTWKFS